MYVRINWTFYASKVNFWVNIHNGCVKWKCQAFSMYNLPESQRYQASVHYFRRNLLIGVHIHLKQLVRSISDLEISVLEKLNICNFTLFVFKLSMIHGISLYMWYLSSLLGKPNQRKMYLKLKMFFFFI